MPEMLERYGQFVRSSEDIKKAIEICLCTKEISFCCTTYVPQKTNRREASMSSHSLHEENLDTAKRRRVDFIRIQELKNLSSSLELDKIVYLNSFNNMSSM